MYSKETNFLICIFNTCNLINLTTKVYSNSYKKMAYLFLFFYYIKNQQTDKQKVAGLNGQQLRNMCRGFLYRPI